MANTRTIDTHAHFFPQSYIDLIAKHGGRCGTSVVRDDKGQLFIQVGLLLRTGPVVPAFYDLDQRLAEMDREGVDVHVLSLTQPMVYWADDQLGLDLCIAFNDAISEAHRKHPERIYGFACLPMQNPRLALEELEPKAYRVTVQKPAYQTETKSLTAAEPSGDHVIELKRGEGIGVVARDGVYGVPLRNLSVRVLDSGGAAGERGCNGSACHPSR